MEETEHWIKIGIIDFEWATLTSYLELLEATILLTILLRPLVIHAKAELRCLVFNKTGANSAENCETAHLHHGERKCRVSSVAIEKFLLADLHSNTLLGNAFLIKFLVKSLDKLVGDCWRLRRKPYKEVGLEAIHIGSHRLTLCSCSKQMDNECALLEVHRVPLSLSRFNDGFFINLWLNLIIVDFGNKLLRFLLDLLVLSKCVNNMKCDHLFWLLLVVKIFASNFTLPILSNCGEFCARHASSVASSSLNQYTTSSGAVGYLHHSS